MNRPYKFSLVVTAILRFDWNFSVSMLSRDPQNGVAVSHFINLV